jgi:hypothetical protein
MSAGLEAALAIAALEAGLLAVTLSVVVLKRWGR